MKDQRDVKESAHQGQQRPEDTGLEDVEQREYTDEETMKTLKVYERRPEGEGQEVPFKNTQILKAVLTNTAFGILSAGRNPSRPEDDNLTEEDLKARNEVLRKDLIRMGYCFTLVQGKYGAPEASYQILIHDADRADMIALGKKHLQESIVFSDHGKNELIYTGDRIDREMGKLVYPEGTIIQGEGYKM